MLGSAKAETQLTIIEVTEHDLFLSPGVIPSQYSLPDNTQEPVDTPCYMIMLL